MKHCCIGLLGMLLLLSSAIAQTSVHTFNFGGVQRSYRVYVPANYTGASAVPLVFNLHGYTSNALQQEFYSGMNSVADTAGFIICYPDGLNASWNSAFQPPYYGGVDDVGFISVLIDTLQQNYNIAPTRVYSCGMSNGGFMSYRLACDLEDRIAAIASVTGSMSTTQLTNCNASRSIPILEIHGTTDATVPYTTTALSIGIDSLLSYWRVQNGCTAPVIRDTLPDLVQEFSTVTTQWYKGCNDNVEVAHYKIQNGGHTWPGALFQIPGLVTNMDIRASVEIWKFFYRFSHPNPTLVARAVPMPALAPVVAPQPSRGEIRVTQLQVGARLLLLDAQGKLMGKWTTTQAEYAIDARQLPTGIYFLRVQQSEQLYALKVLVTE
jgi:polyhydroxybutyrate depolymerase